MHVGISGNLEEKEMANIGGFHDGASDLNLGPTDDDLLAERAHEIAINVFDSGDRARIVAYIEEALDDDPIRFLIEHMRADTVNALADAAIRQLKERAKERFV